MGAEFTMMWYLVPLAILILLTTILSVLDKHFRRTVLTMLAVCLGNCAVTAIVGLLFGINIAAAVFVNLIFFSLCMSSVLRMIRYARLIKTGSREYGLARFGGYGKHQHCDISYCVDGEEYEFRQHIPWSAHHNDTVIVYYDSKKPKTACTESRFYHACFELCIAAPVFICVLLGTLLI